MGTMANLLALTLIAGMAQAWAFRTQDRGSKMHVDSTGKFPNYECDENGANELLEKYKTARVDAVKGPNEIAQIVTDEVSYRLPILGTYRGKTEVIKDYLNKNPAKPGENYRNDVLKPATDVKVGVSAKGTLTFDAKPLLWWKNGLTATITLTCSTTKRWLITSIYVA